MGRMSETLRDVTAKDVDAAMSAVRACGLFEPEELPILRQQLERTAQGLADREEFWVASFDDDGAVLGVAFCVQETLTDRVWNLLFIGVDQWHQDRGIGGRMLDHVEDRLRANGQRMLVIETTNGPEFEGTQAFYRRHGYEEEGTVRDFYADGAHKIAFRKLL